MRGLETTYHRFSERLAPKISQVKNVAVAAVVREEHPLYFQFHIPTRIISGPGTLAELEDTRHLPPGEHAMIVTGESDAMLKTGYLQRVQGYLANRGVATILFDRIKPNPESETVDEGAAVARDKQVDFVVGLGGGSTIDSAKSIALMARNGGSYWDYMRGGSGGEKTPDAPALPIVALPTTAGSGTEANPWTVITRSGHREKIGWGNESTFPHLSIVDPQLTLSLPLRMIAYTGMSAFFNAVAAILASSRQPASDMLALEAIQIISRFLPCAVKDGADQNARTMLSWASTAAGMCAALASGVSHHALAHALSAFAPRLSHGAGLTLSSEAYFSWLATRRPERFDLLADAMGRMPEDETVDGARRFPAALRHLIQSVGLGDESLANYGLGTDDVPALARHVVETMDALCDVTPVPRDLPDIEAILSDTMRDSRMRTNTGQANGSSAKTDPQRRSSHGP